MRVVLFSFFLFIVCTVHAQRIQYDCRGCTLTVDEKHRIQKVAEYETAFFDDVFGPRRRQTIRIRYYSDEKKFRQGQRTTMGHVISETGAYASAPRLILIFKWERFMATSFHECSHAIYHHHAAIRPDWIDEGLAEYFKGASVDSLDNITINPHWGRRLDMKKYVADSSFSIRKTINASYRKFHGHNESMHYSKSWGIVYYLRTQYDGLFKTILYKVSHGVRSEKAIEDEYPGGMEQLTKDLVRFYK